MSKVSPSSSLPAAPANALARNDVRTLVLAALGGALEFYDFVVFVFFTKLLGQLFFPHDIPAWLAQLQVYGIFAAGYLARPLGGVVMAHFGDRSGRKRMFALSVLLMALPTLGIGLLPVYAQVQALAPVLLLILRLVQGIAVGGEVPGAWVFVAEHAPPGRVGFACAALTAGLTAGILVGSVVAAALGRMAPGTLLAYGWRLPFVLGGVFGFCAVWLRRWLSETPVFTELRERRALAQGLPLKEVLRGHLGGVLVCVLATWMLTAAIVVLLLMTPTLVQTSFHIDGGRAFLGDSLATLALIVGCLGAGLAADRIGRARTLLLGSLALLAATYALYLDLAHGARHFLALYALAGLLAGVVGVVPAVMVAAFPPAIRFSGLSFSYNLAYAVFGVATPPLVGYLAACLGGLAPAHYIAVAALVCMGLAVYLGGARRPAWES